MVAGSRSYNVENEPAPEESGAGQVTMYSQRDDRWQRVYLGESTSTIGGYGCLICSICSGLTDVGLRMNGLPPDPPRLNRWLARNKGFLGDAGAKNRFVFNSLAPLGVELVDYADYRKSSANVANLEYALEQEHHFVAIQVDFKPGGGEEQHWVRAVRMTGDDVEIMDPWITGPTQAAYLMTHYALPSWEGPSRAIYRMVVYRYDPAAAIYGVAGQLNTARRPRRMFVQEELCEYRP